MASLQSNTLVQKVRSVHKKYPWVWLYFVTLFTLLAWGVITTRFLPIVEANSRLPAELSYEQIAPGWASQDTPRSILEPWLRWDAAWYLLIAKDGYSAFGRELAFLPGYPMVTRLLGKLLGGQYLLASLIVSWSAVFGICLLLEERFYRQAHPKTAVRGIRNLLFFPTAIFFFAGYTESLFLLLVLLAWRFAEKGNWLLAGILGGLATLTRFQGVLLILPFGLMWLRNWREHRVQALLAFFPIPLAYFGWDLFVRLSYQTQPYLIQTQGWSSHFDWPWVGIFGSLKRIFSSPASESFSAALDILAVLIAVISIMYWLRKKAYPEVSFMAVVILISVTKITDAGMLGSVSRFIIPLFPIYLMLAEWGKQIKYDRLILVVSIFLWLFCAALFFSWNWLA